MENNRELTQEEINELFDNAQKEKENSKKQGQSMVEYALILAFVSLVCFVALRGLGLQVKYMFERVNTSLTQITQASQQEPTNPPTPPTPPCNNGNGHGHGYGRCK